MQLVDIIVKHSWVPDVLIFQYVFSDMYKHSDEEEIIQFINKLADFLNSYEEKSIYILCNDINLTKSKGGGREFFDILESKINKPKIVKKGILIILIGNDTTNMESNIIVMCLSLMIYQMK